MSHTFLSDLAQRVSLHPGCRVELRHHWPAPHYHKTPDDIAEEAEELQRRRAARAALFSYSQYTTSNGQATTSGANAVDEPFNPFEHFRVRKKREEKRSSYHRREHHRGMEHGTEENRDAPLVSAAVRMRNHRSGSRSATSGSESAADIKEEEKKVTSSSSNGAVTAKGSKSTATHAVSRHAMKENNDISKAINSHKKSNGEMTTTTILSPLLPASSSAASPLSQQHSEHVSGTGSSPTAATTNNRIGDNTDTNSSATHRKDVKITHETVALTKAVHAAATATKARETKKKNAETTKTAAAASEKAPASCSSSRSGSAHSPCTHSGHSSGSGSDHRSDSDLSSDELVPCRDPLRIRLPRNPVHHAMGGVPRPLHVIIRWSGAQQRRRRHIRQQQRRRQREVNNVESGALPQRQVTMTPSAIEAAAANNGKTSPNPSDPHQAQEKTYNSADYTTNNSSISNHHRENAEEEDKMYGPDSHQYLRSCSSDTKTQGDETSLTRPPATSVRVGRSGVSAFGSKATSHYLHPSSTTDEVSHPGGSDPRLKARQQQQQGHHHVTEDGDTPLANSCNLPSASPSRATSPQQQQQQQHYARQPVCKSTTIFSQSTTTGPRTSILGITSSDLPTPSSSVDPYAAAAFTRSCLRRPNSLLIVRSPPQDNSSEDILVAANGLYYCSSPSVYNRGGVNGTSCAAGSGTGLHGPQQQSASNLRVTYVTNNANRRNANTNANNISSSTEGCAAQQQQQTPQLRGLAHVPQPYALTITGQGLHEGGCYDHTRSHSGSPTTIVVPGSSTNGVTRANFSSTTPPNSLPSTPLQTSSAQNAATYNSNNSNVAGAHTRPSGVTTPAGQQTPPPLSMKTVIVQRRRSSLLRQQQQRRQQQPFFSFFPSPGAVAATLLYKKSTTPVSTTPPKLLRVQSAASAADTVAFSPLNVHLGTKTNPSPLSALTSHGPISVDAIEHSPPLCETPRHEKSGSPSEVNNHSTSYGDKGGHSRVEDFLSAPLNKSCSNITLHEDPMLLGYLPTHPQRNPSELSINRGAGCADSCLRPLHLAQPYQSHTDVPPTAAPYGTTSGSFGVSGQYGGNLPYDAVEPGDGSYNYNNNLNNTLSSLAATQLYGATFPSLSFPTAMWINTRKPDHRDSTLLHPLQQPFSQQQPETPLGRWSYIHPCVYAPSENSAWVEHTRLDTTTSTAALTPMMPNSSSYMGNGLYSEPATPMFLPQQQQQSHHLHPFSSLSPQQPQPGPSYSATSTPHLTQLPPPPASSTAGTPATYVPVRRSRSNLIRALALAANPGVPHVPAVFCKLQRTDVQRLRRRGPLLPPGTECPGLAARLAYAAYRDAVRRGLVNEEEECSYYLSHHRYSPIPTPTSATAAVQSVGTAGGGQFSASTPTSQLSTRVSDSSPPPPLRGRPSSLLSAARPLCVVSLADCRATTAPSLKRADQERQQREASAGKLSTAQDKETTTAATTASTSVHSKVNSPDNDEADEQRSNSDNGGGSELSELWNGPRFLYQIPRCCDDPYHRDEEALEMISVTTASSCAYGAGLDGLSWREWMPSSPVEAGEEILHSLSLSPSTAAAAASSGTHSPQTAHTAATAQNVASGNSLHGPLLNTHAGFSGSTSFTVPPAALVAGVTPTPKNTSGNLNVASAVGLMPPTPSGIAAPRNADDIGLADTADSMDNDFNNGGSPQLHHCVQTGAPTNSAGDRAGVTAPSTISRRPFIAEWLVSKLQKHMEKKKLKKLKKRQEREAATAAAVLGSTTPPLHAEECFLLPTDPVLGRSRGELLHAHSTTSTLSDYSEASSPRSSSPRHYRQHQQQHHQQSSSAATSEPSAQERQLLQNRLAYLATAYQTELVIYEQKRRELLENRRGLSTLVERSRTRMTPEAAAAGYFYETQGDYHNNNHHHCLLHPQTREASSFSPRLATKAPEEERTGGALHHGGNCSVKCPSSSSFTHSSSYSSNSSSGYSLAAVSVASPVPTDRASVNSTPNLPPLSQSRLQQADRREYAPDALPHKEEEENEPLSSSFHEQAQRQQRQSSKEQLFGLERRRAMAKKVEAERMQVALDTLRTKQKSIENWIHAMRRQW